MQQDLFMIEWEKQIDAYLEASWITSLSNLCAVVKEKIPDLNWAGFYLWNGQELALGPFQGKPACTRIASGRGVCGAAFSKRETLRVGNVHEFSGHIVCDTNSNSELVVPLLLSTGLAIGVLDLDSATFNRFGDPEQRLATILAQKVSAHFEKLGLDRATF